MSREPAAPTIAEIQAQDAGLSFERFGHDEAWALGADLRAHAREHRLPVAIGVWLGEQRVFHAGLPGTSADNDGWLQRKRAVVTRYDCPSLQTALRWREAGISSPDPVLGLDPSQHALSGGAFPIRLRGTTVGVVAVSGLHEAVDHDLVVQALTRLAGTT